MGKPKDPLQELENILEQRREADRRFLPLIVLVGVAIIALMIAMYFGLT